MRLGPTKQLYTLTVVYPNGMTRSIKVKAASREVAERRALKHAPGAISVQRP